MPDVTVDLLSVDEIVGFAVMKPFMLLPCIRGLMTGVRYKPGRARLYGGVRWFR
jgi:hypothetical protein